jgi:hypothetical protein
MKLTKAYETEIVAKSGYVWIEQEDTTSEGSSTILLHANQLKDVIDELQALLDDRASWEHVDNDDAPAPLRVVDGGK